MATIINPEIKTILQNDPAFAGLEYEALRQLGLEHIAKLSGRIWTDHNVHDPGITTLESLCYALLDLGYRTKLPIGQILATDPNETTGLPQFFSPAQILSSEPATILDYRRLLLDVPGVKNAWLEVAKEETVEISYSAEAETDYEGQADKDRFVAKLNGLYQLILQLDDPDSEARESVLAEVRQTLLAHRNLGEDFLNLDQPIILRECAIPLAAQIEIEDEADPAKVFRDLVEQTKQFFCPQLNYYTLGELLAKGKNIEDIYAGRPYTTSSFGFIDPEELLALRQQKEIHFSDLYSLVLGIDGVKRIRELSTSKELATVQSDDGSICLEPNSQWLLHLPLNTYPVFDLDNSAITLFRKKESYDGRSLQESPIFRQSLSDRQKVRYQSALPDLDIEAPKEAYREDLADYYSIQHDFPKVYGIGLDGLGPSASAERRAKALQFKGYLLFFERLLADFLAQLGALASYFALIPESERPQAYQQTFFAQGLDSVPQIEKLNRLSTYAQSYAWTPDKPIARFVHKKDLFKLAGSAPLATEPKIETYTFDNLESRTIAIQNIKTAFLVNRDLKVSIATKESGAGFYFGIYFEAYDYAWLSEQSFATEAEAFNAANLLSGQLDWPDTLKLLSEPCHLGTKKAEAEKNYSIQWIYTPPRLNKYAQAYAWTPTEAIACLVPKDELFKLAIIAPLDRDPQVPTYTFDNPESRAMAIHNLKKAFLANQDFKISIANKAPREGYYFGIYFEAYDYAWLSVQTYTTEAEALSVASLLRAELDWPDSLELISEPYELSEEEKQEAEKHYSIQWIYAPPEELSYLHLLLENPERYQSRRHQFLDHLLARFAERFTDYSLQMYAMFGANSQTDAELLEVKSQYLARFDRLAHDRAHAFDYGSQAWGVENLSGLEANLAARLGVNWQKRESLCPFIPIEYEKEYELKLRADKESEFFQSTQKYSSQESALNDLKSAIANLKAGGQLRAGDGIEQSNRRIFLPAHNKYLQSHALFPDQQSLELQLQTWDQQYREKANPENTEVTRHAFHLQLKDAQGNILFEDERITDQADKSWKHEATFIKKYQKHFNQNSTPKISLIALPNQEVQHLYLDKEKLALTQTIDKGRFRWQIVHEGQVVLISTAVYADKSEAESAILHILSSSPECLSIIQKQGQFFLQIDEEICARSPFDGSQEHKRLLDWLKQHQTGQQYVKRVAQAYKWQLFDPEQSQQILLETPQLFADKKRLEKSWSRFKTAGSVNGNYKFKTLENGHWEVWLHNKQGELIARSPQEGIPAEDKAGLLNRLKTLFQRKTNSKIVAIDEAYAYQLNDTGGKLSLQSFNLYLSAYEAWDALLKLPRLAKSTKHFIKTGDVANLNYGFFVQDAQGALQAIHPEVYEEESLRDEQIKLAKKLLKDFQKPYQTQIEYRFLYRLNDHLLLAGEQWYFTTAKARAEGKKYLKNLIHPDFLQQEIQTEQGESRLFLMHNAEQIACARASAENLAQGLKKWREYLAAETLEVTMFSEPDQWQFRYFWPSAAQEWALLLESVVGYDSELLAQNAYVDFVQRLAALTIVEEAGTAHFYVDDAEQHWLKSVEFSDKDKRASAVAWLKANREEAEKIRLLAEASLDDEPASLLANIYKTDQTGEGIWGYQLIKKENPIAILQGEGSEELNQNACRQHWGDTIAVSRVPDLKLGSGLYNGLFHYEITEESEGERQVYFVSAKGYLSAAEAIEASQEQYIQILHFAAEASNYAEAPEGAKGPVYLHGSSEGAFASDLKQEEIAFVPEETFTALGGTKEKLIAFLVPLAEGFPLKIQTHICQGELAVWADTLSYYYKLSLDETRHWQAFQNYQTPAAVYEAWCEFMLWKEYRESYHCFEDWAEELPRLWGNRAKQCDLAFSAGVSSLETSIVNSYCAIYEVCLESSARHANENEIWQGRSALAGEAPNPQIGIPSLTEHGGKKANYLIYWDYAINSYRLRVGAEGYQLVEHPESFQLPEDRDQRLQWLAQIPSFRPENSTSVDDYCLVAAETPGNYRFYLYAMEEGKGRLAWRSAKIYQSIDYQDETEAVAQAKADCKAFCELWEENASQNWGEHPIIKATQDSTCGPYRIVGIAAQYEIAHYPLWADTFAAASSLKNEVYACLNAEGFHLLEHILFRPKAGGQLDRCLSKLHGFEAVKECALGENVQLSGQDLFNGEPYYQSDPHSAETDDFNYVPLADPLSFWCTLVLPQWSYRYTFENFQELLLDELNAYAPAQIAFKICWLPPQEMCQFEKQYRHWLKQQEKNLEDQSFASKTDGLTEDDCSTNFWAFPNCGQEQTIVTGQAEAKSEVQQVRVQARGLEPISPVSEPTAPIAPKETIADSNPTPKAKPKAKKKAASKPQKESQEAAKVLTKRDKTRLIRQRLATYREFLDGIQNKNILKSSSYKRLDVLLNSQGSPAEIKAFVDFLFQYPLKNPKSKTYADYLPLLFHAVSFGLDQTLITANQAAMAQWPEVMKELKAQKIKMKSLREAWDSTKMEPLVETQLMRDLSALIK